MDKSRSAFAEEVSAGLSAQPKKLSSKWFYDAKGDALFVRIMNMPEYYLTDCELEIFKHKTDKLISDLIVWKNDFDLFELGAGNGTKTIHLLKALANRSFTYRPIDISKNAIKQLKKRLNEELPSLDIQGLQGEYFEVLNQLSADRPKAILFMGSNIGNLLDDRANAFLKGLSNVMKKGDRLLLGVDLKKDKEIILPAYNDSQGITAAFNLNLLERINRELGGDFRTEYFSHTPQYDENTGIAASYLTSLKEQTVCISALDESYTFKKGEKVFTEISRKYDQDTLDLITSHTNLELVSKVFDSREYFCDVIYEKR